MTKKEYEARMLVVTWPGWVPPLVDFLLIMVGFALAYYARYQLQLLRPLDEIYRAPFEPFIPYALLYACILLLMLHQRNLYTHVRGRSWGEDLISIIIGMAVSLVLVTAVSFFLQPLVFSRLLLLYAGFLSVVLLAAVRVAYRVIRARQRKRGIGVEKVLVVGAGEVGRAVMRNMIARPDLGYKVIGFVDDDPTRGAADLGRLKALGELDNLPGLINDEDIDLVIVTLSWEHQRKILRIVRECDRQDVGVRIVPDMFQLQLNRVQIENLQGIPLLGLRHDVHIPHLARHLKRAMDILLIVLSSIVWLPVCSLIALAIRLEDPGPVFYGQERIGKNGRPFKVWKFRSMVTNADELKAQLIEDQGLDPRHPKLKHDPRITRIGHLIRRFSMDELPQIFNVLLGDMSLVGPRPPTPDEVGLYEPWHRQRLQVRGGLTGLWQVSGRSDVPFEEMVLLDLYYIENWSLLLDIQIILRTVPRVLLGDGAY